MPTVLIKLRLLTLLSVYDVEKIKFLDSTNTKRSKFMNLVITDKGQKKNEHILLTFNGHPICKSWSDKFDKVL